MFWEAVLAVIERERDMARQPGFSGGSPRAFFLAAAPGCSG
jgi:hypothetical protein